MGVRIHKVVGYGLDNVKIKDHKFNDHRINVQYSDGFYEKLYKFDEWLKKYNSKVAYMLHAIYKIPLTNAIWDINWAVRAINMRKSRSKSYDGFVHNTEMGLSEVMIFVPLEYLDKWKRRDDTIDWIEETYFADQKDTVLNLFTERDSCGISPYQTMTLNPFRENKTLSKVTKMLSSQYNQLTGRWDKNIAPEENDDDRLKHLKEDWLPIIPTTVAAMCMYLNIFTKPEYLYELRPLYYTYWG